MKKLLISTKVVENPNYVEVSSIIADEYIAFFEKLGYLLIPVVNNSNNVKEYFDICEISGVILIGGNNTNPKLYGGEENLSDVYPQRDRTEKILLDCAIEKNIPVVGICRGFQFINVYFGGSVTHSIKDHVRKPHKLLSDNPILSNKVTNTFHNQGILEVDLSKNLINIAQSEDGFVEAIKHKNHSVLGVQWHPERQDMEFDKKLIGEFLRG